MLNRTNRTLSANTNRLNLGTRSLAALAGFNTDCQTLRLRHDHPSKRSDSMRVGVMKSIMGPVFTVYPIEITPSSPPAPAWPTEGRPAWSRARVVAGAPGSVWPVVADDRACRTAGPRDRARPRTERERGQRSQRGPLGQGQGLLQAADQLSLSSDALTRASGG
jgi:hypothetical protein